MTSTKPATNNHLAKTSLLFKGFKKHKNHNKYWPLKSGFVIVARGYAVPFLLNSLATSGPLGNIEALRSASLYASMAFFVAATAIAPAAKAPMT